MRRVRFHPDAEAEFIAATQFYETQAAELGLEFVTEVRSAARTPRSVIDSPSACAAFLFAAFPMASSIVSSQTRSSSLP